MSGIEREITLDTRHIAKHLPDTPQIQRLLRREGFVHVFNDEATMLRVAQAIIENGEFTGIIRNHERYGLYFASAIGYRIDINGSQIPLHYGEINIMSFPAPDLANNWQFTEIWVDPTSVPPYILMLLGDDKNNFCILDPTENYKIIFACSSYEEAKLWLLEDEYERVEGRVLAEQVA